MSTSSPVLAATTTPRVVSQLTSPAAAEVMAASRVRCRRTDEASPVGCSSSAAAASSGKATKPMSATEGNGASPPCTICTQHHQPWPAAQAPVPSDRQAQDSRDRSVEVRARRPAATAAVSPASSCRRLET